MKKFEGKIQDNFDNYLKKDIQVGFMQKFPVANISKTKKYKMTCRNFPVNIEVSLARGTYGENNEYECDIVVTNEISISEHLSLRGFGSYCHIDEAQVMEKAIVQFCKEENLMICDKACSWPFAKAVVQENFYKN